MKNAVITLFCAICWMTAGVLAGALMIAGPFTFIEQWACICAGIYLLQPLYDNFIQWGIGKALALDEKYA